MKQETSSRGYVQLLVALDLEPGSDGPSDEWVWAEPMGSRRYRVESTPFFAYGLSHGDQVCAVEEDDTPRLEAVERKSGHRTLRAALDLGWEVSHPDVQALLDGLLALGCSYEAMPPQIVAVDVPPHVEVGRVLNRLQALARDGVLVWEWADPRPS